MSQECLDELIDMLADSEQEDFPQILESIIEYGFLDDVQISALLEIDLTEVDELLCSADHLKAKVWKFYSAKLAAALKKERRKYARLYYKNPS